MLIRSQYISNKSRFIIRAAGDFDFGRANEVLAAPEEESETENEMSQYEKHGKQHSEEADGVEKQAGKEPVDISSYRPTVKDRTWFISETDLDWISIGCYILGTGGGGSPYQHMLRMREILRQGGVIRVVNPQDLNDADLVGCGGGAGSPTVSIEKLQGDE